MLRPSINWSCFAIQRSICFATTKINWVVSAQIIMVKRELVTRNCKAKRNGEKSSLSSSPATRLPAIGKVVVSAQEKEVSLLAFSSSSFCLHVCFITRFNCTEERVGTRAQQTTQTFTFGGQSKLQQSSRTTCYEHNYGVVYILLCLFSPSKVITITS